MKENVEKMRALRRQYDLFHIVIIYSVFETFALSMFDH